MTGFDHVKGGERHQTEADYEREVSNAARRAAESRRFRKRLTVDTDDSTAVLYRCGCVAAVEKTRQAACEFLHWQLHDNPAVDPAKWAGATLTPAYAVFVGPQLTVYRRDDVELPMPGRRSSEQCDTHGRRPA